MHISDCCQFSDIHISQGSVATYLRCGWIFKYEFVANLPVSLAVKEFWKSVNIWGSYGQEFSVLFFFWDTVYCLCSTWETQKRENRAFQMLCLWFAGVQPVAAWFLQYCWPASHIRDAVWLHKYCTVISLVHFWAAGAIAVGEMKFCITATELCCTNHALQCAVASCCWNKKIASTVCWIINSILMIYWDILLITQRSSAVTKW